MCICHLRFFNWELVNSILWWKTSHLFARVSHIVRTNKLMHAAHSINARTRTIKRKKGNEKWGTDTRHEHTIPKTNTITLWIVDFLENNWQKKVKTLRIASKRWCTMYTHFIFPSIETTRFMCMPFIGHNLVTLDLCFFLRRRITFQYLLSD